MQKVRRRCKYGVFSFSDWLGQTCLERSLVVTSLRSFQSIRSVITARCLPRIPWFAAMAPKTKGGAGQKSAQDYVTGLWSQGMDEAAMRQHLREDGYKAGRISQLIKATRPAQGQVGRAAAAPRGSAKAAAARGGTAARKRPSASSSALNREAGARAQHFTLGICSTETHASPVTDVAKPDEDSDGTDFDEGQAIADGDSTEAESESDDELNVHRFLADMEAEMGEGNNRAELDHLDSMGCQASSEDEQQVRSADEQEEALQAFDPQEESSDEEEEKEHEGQDAEGDEPAWKRARGEQQQIPGARRLRYKQPPPAAYLQMAAAATRKVLKRPAVHKRPAASKVPDSKRCHGHQGVACTFCPVSPGEAARVQPARGIQQCVFCEEERMREAHATSRQEQGKQEITKALRKFYTANRSVFDLALERVKQFLGAADAEDYHKKAEPKEDWERHLRHRQLAGKELKDKEKSAYEALVRRDQRVPRRKFFFPEKQLARAGEEAEAAEKAAVKEACGEIGHVASNDTDLPLPTDQKAKMVEKWCKHGSWGMCEKCHSMCPRKLTPMDLKRVNKATVPKSQCTACKHGEYVPQPEDIPVPLRGLKRRVLEALRPLTMDIGFVERVPNGYRVHNAMMAFAWKERNVETEIAALRKRGDRRAAKEAFEFLLGSQHSAYKEILQEHQKFLNKHGNRAPLSKRKRPLRFIETKGLECCLWPHLYWHRDL
eukprot:s1226_g42.t1